MKLTTVFFDLDGTLLPMDQEVFVKVYFGLLAKKMAPLGYPAEALIKSIWDGTEAMMRNTGERNNEAVFWDKFCQVFGERALADAPVLEAFYREEFQQAQAFCGRNPEAAGTVYAIRDLGCRLVLATNPIFPAVATMSRIRWAGLEPEDFELITTYENAGYCKPNPAYFWDLLHRLNLRPEECLMVGNDVDEDMAARPLGMDVFLLTDCMINRNGRDITQYPRGSFPELLAYVRERL